MSKTLFGMKIEEKAWVPPNEIALITPGVKYRITKGELEAYYTVKEPRMSRWKNIKELIDERADS